MRSRLEVWWLPVQRLLWAPTTNLAANARFLANAQGAVLLIHAEQLDDSLLAQLFRKPGSLVSVSTHIPEDRPNV